MDHALAYTAGVLAMVVGIAVSIALHEVGHLVPAKRFGVRVTQYMVGFGPTLWSRRRGETEYGVKAIPLGGYIRMIGMFPPRPGTPAGMVGSASSNPIASMVEQARAESLEELRPGDEKRTFYGLSVPKKLVIMLGGPVMNLLIAVVLLTVVVSGFGVPTLTTQVQTVSRCVLPVDAPADAECSPSDPAAPAAAAGLRPGDTLLAIGGVPTPTWDAVSEQIRLSGGRRVDVRVERDGRELTLQATPIVADVIARDEDGLPVEEADGSFATVRAGFLGVSPVQATVRQPLTSVPGQVADAVVGTVGVVARLPQYMVGVGQAAFGGGERDPDGPVSVVGVGRFAGEVAALEDPAGEFGLRERVAQILAILAGLNVALFVFNLIPLLPLDGGHVAGALWEGTKKTWARARNLPDPGPVDVAKALPVAYGVAVVLLGMAVVLIYADVVNPIRLTG
ncbi:M50 family metallopeptidase [Aquipuribacter nitratireducens]|uniref:M50 family metallopeptidase n=1 Tax=Aquipuribacter nitratireducens TaxID=650104 RepID=A0ABW0GKC4_9MICO